MVEVNWHRFQSKFGDSSPIAFERLCYFVFCQKFEQPFGVARCRNHPGLETEPIMVKGELVGFQSKFYFGKFSDHKDDIKESIDKIGKRYANLRRLVYFMPIDHDFNTRSTTEDISTQDQKEIEGLAGKYGFVIEWFCHSKFEAVFFDKKNDGAGLYFFSNSPCLIDLYNVLDACTTQFSARICDSLVSGTKSCKLDRREVIDRFLCEGSNVVYVLYGEGGVGKSAVAKELIGRADTSWVVEPQELIELLSPRHLIEKWGTSIDGVLDGISDSGLCVLVVDAAEKIENLDLDKSLYYGIISQFVLRGWRVVLTVRTRFFDMLMRHLGLYLRDHIVKYEEVKPLSDKDLSKIESQLSVCIPYENVTANFLSVPFYLDLFLRDKNGFEKAGLSNFKRSVWARVVQGGNSQDTAAEYFQRMISSQVEHRTYWLDISGMPASDILTLVDRGVLTHNVQSGQYRVSHDIYEEIALEHLIESIRMSSTAKEFFAKMPNNRSTVRAFRMWMLDKLIVDSNSVHEIVRHAFSQDNQLWVNEVTMAIVTSPLSAKFLSGWKKDLLADNAKKLHCVLNLVRCACKEPRKDMPLSFKHDDLTKYYFTKPSGNAWRVLIEFVCDNQDCLLGFDLAEIISFIQEWVQVNPTGPVARKAGLFAMHVALQSDGERKKFETHYDSWPVLAKIITACSSEIHDELKEFVESTLADFDPSTVGIQRDIYTGVLEQPYEHVNFIREFPQLTRRMAMASWFAKRNHYYSAEWPDEVFGLSDVFTNSHGMSSAYQTPVYLLLKFDFKATLDFILEVVNKAVCHAAEWKQDDIGIVKTTITMPTGKHVEQFISPALWTMHRGVVGPVTPHLLQSIHMALERFFLERHKSAANDNQCVATLERIALHCIEASKSASITGALTSLVLAYPKEYFTLATVVLSSREMIQTDYARGICYEPQCASLYALYGTRDFMYATERAETLKDRFRSETLESIMLRYQYDLDDGKHQRKGKMLSLLDGYGMSKREEDQFFVLRCDSRKHRVEQCMDKNGRNTLLLVPDVPHELEKRSNEAQAKVLPNHIAQKLMMWGSARIKGEAIPQPVNDYEENPKRAITDFEYIYDLVLNGDSRIILPSALPYAAAVFLYFYASLLDSELRSKCENLLLESAKTILNAQYRCSVFDGVDISIAALPLLITSIDKKPADEARYILIASMLVEDTIGMSQHRLCDTAFESIRRNEASGHILTDTYLPPYIYLRTKLAKFISGKNNRHRIFESGSWLSEFLRCNETMPYEALKVSSFDVDELIKDPNALYSLGNAILLINPTRENAEQYKELIIGSIEPVLNSMYCVEKDSGRIGTKHLNAYASQYQRQLSRMLLLMNDDTLKLAIDALQKIEYLCYDHWFLSALINEEDAIGEHDNFWRIWKSLLRNAASCFVNDRFHCEFDSNGVFEHIFLGKTLWKSTVTEWKSFHDGDIDLYKDAVSLFPASLGELAALASFCNGIGCAYWEDVLNLMATLIASLVENRYWRDDPMKYAVSNLEMFCLKVVSENAERIKSCESIWKKMMVVLDWLVERQSSLAYQLREQLI